MESRVCGFFKFEAIKPDGTKRVLADWFPNLITNIGLNRMGTNSSWMSSCQVGTGNTTPTVTDTSLAARIAGTSTRQSTSFTAQPSAPYYTTRTNVYRFTAGATEGILAEVGVGWSSTASDSMFSRALILDGTGTPTTLTMLADEILDVTYALRIYPPASDISGSVTLRGTNHTLTIRAMLVTATGTNGWYNDETGIIATIWTASSQTFYDGAIGAVTGSPAGSSSNANSATNVTYVANSFTLAAVVTAGLANANFGTGITAFRLKMGFVAYQIGFSPAIMKTSSDSLVLNVSHTWARKTL